MMPTADPIDRAIALLRGLQALLVESRVVARELDTDKAGPLSQTAAADRIVYGAVAAALEGGLVSTLERMTTMLRRFGGPAATSAEMWFDRQTPARRSWDSADDADLV